MVSSTSFLLLTFVLLFAQNYLSWKTLSKSMSFGQTLSKMMVRRSNLHKWQCDWLWGLDPNSSVQMLYDWSALSDYSTLGNQPKKNYFNNSPFNRQTVWTTTTKRANSIRSDGLLFRDSFWIHFRFIDNEFTQKHLLLLSFAIVSISPPDALGSDWIIRLDHHPQTVHHQLLIQQLSQRLSSCLTFKLILAADSVLGTVYNRLKRRIQSGTCPFKP